MLQVINKTPFNTKLGLFTDQHGTDKVVTAVKGTFKIPYIPAKKLELADNQLEILFCDEYFGEPGKSSIKYPVDVVLGKAGTDIGLVGHAQSKAEKPVTHIPVNISVGNLQKTILVIGDRSWKKKKLMPGFYISKPETFTKMPLLFERAFGGADNFHKNQKKHGYHIENPIGTGFRLNKESVENHRLPNLEDPENLISHWKDKPNVMSLGFIDSSWPPRIKYAGTYDEEWKKNQSPLLPMDFQIEFFNSASAGLRSKNFIKGSERINLINLSPKGALEFRLPDININLIFYIGRGSNIEKADLWTILFEPDEERFYLVWGKSFPIGKQLSKMRYVKVEMEGNL